MNNIEHVQRDLENRDVNRGDLVVVGSSAGGVEALSILVSTLPADFPAPIVLAQHLDPSRTSNLDAILRRRAILPVELVETSCLLEKGKIYVVPANRHVTIIDGHVEVKGDHNKRPRPSVDLLLSSAAEIYGERLIAVILTGSGSDGASGAAEVKNLGGIVIVQDPQTARYPAMPLALSPSVIDFEADIEHIGQLLYDLLTGVNKLPHAEEKTEDILKDILEQVSRQASIDFRQYKSSTILRRIGRRMAVTHQKTMRDYLEYLANHPEEVGELVKAFLINVTQFFRDADAFAYLKSEILPRLIDQARERDKVLRVWVAGCASGEEPYSIAMLLTDLLGVELSTWSVKIFATDLDEAAITFARRGLYSESLLKDVPNEYRTRFFERVDHGYRIAKTLRQMVIFGQQDLSRSAPFPRINLVLCRNVLIYFAPELQDYVLHQFAFSLSPGGYLFLGKAESIRPAQSYYELVNKQWKVYLCTSSAIPFARRNAIGRSTNGAHPTSLTRKPIDKIVVDEQLPTTSELGQLRRLNELLLRFLPMGVVVIDHSYHVITANGTARRLLGLRDLGNEQDFLHAVRGIPYTTVRNAIDAVFRERNTINLPEIELDVAVGGNGRFISLSIVLMQMEAGMPEMAVMSVVDVTEQIQIRRQLEAAQMEQTQLMDELSSANKRLNNVNKELLDANEELQVANEELMLTHEELQATIEEFETTNEELQATNEELETNNEELQATNEELETTNEELRARTGELQELMTMLESERVRFAEMVELAPFYILALRGPQLLVDAYNPRYARLLEGRTVLGQPLADVYELFWEAGIEGVRLAREVYQQDSTRTTPRLQTYMLNAQNGASERYFSYTIVPSHDASGKVTGVIIYAVDETLQQERSVEEERERLKLIFENSTEIALGLFDAHTAELLLGSPHFLKTLAQINGCDERTLLGKKWHDMTSPPLLSEQRDAAWTAALAQRSPYHLPEIRLKLLLEESETIWLWSLTPIVAAEHQESVQYVLVSLVEVTEQVHARQEMEQLNQLKDDFLSLVGHELRTPLTAILGYAELMMRQREEQSELHGKEGSDDTLTNAFKRDQHHLESIIRQIQSMDKMINEMLDLTRVRGELFHLNLRENVNLVALVRQVVDQLAEASGREIIVEMAEETIQVTVDEARFEQVLNNLISNALKYSLFAKSVVVGIARKEEQAVVWVQDKGKGMSEQEQTHVFERFYRVHPDANVHVKGLGLGLYIAREIINRLGGRIWVESKVDEGSTFYVSLPLT